MAKKELVEGTPISPSRREWEAEGAISYTEDISIQKEEEKIIFDNENELIVEVTQHIAHFSGGPTCRDSTQSVGSGGTNEYTNIYQLRICEIN